MKSNLIICFGLCLFILIPKWVFGAEFQALVGIPGLETYSGPGSLNQYINALYRLSISIAALLAVIKIVVAGAKYMLSDIVPAKEEAKKDIQGALIGLLIVIGAIIILNTINTDLTKLNLAVPVQEITQGQTLEQAIYDAVTAACDRPGRSQACATLVCENIVGINKFEIKNGEDETSACRRACLTEYRGAFTSNLNDPRSATCEYDPAVAQQCDVDSSWNCCVDIKKQTWYSGHNKCSTNQKPLDEIVCDMGTIQQNAGICATKRAECLASGNTVVSESNRTSPGGGEYVSILCTNNAATEEFSDAQNVIANSNFTAPTQQYDANQLSQLSTLLGETVTNSSDIIGINTIPWNTLDATVYGDFPNSNDLEQIANVLSSKCSGSKVAYTVTNSTASEVSADFYCLR